MKKVIFSALVLSGGLFACGKADIQSNDLGSKEVISTPSKTGGGEHKRTWHDDGSRPGVIGATFGCVGMGGTCAQAKPVLTGDAHIFIDISNGGSIVDHFVNNQVAMINYFSLPTVEAVIIGDLSVETLGDLNSEMYFVFSEEGNVTKVVPVTK